MPKLQQKQSHPLMPDPATPVRSMVIGVAVLFQNAEDGSGAYYKSSRQSRNARFKFRECHDLDLVGQLVALRSGIYYE